MHQFHKFILPWNSACFGQFICPSSEVYSPYTQQWCMSYSFRAGAYASARKPFYKPVWHIPFLSVHWINSWWWTEELSETCRVSWQNNFVKLVHLVGFITKTISMLMLSSCWPGMFWFSVCRAVNKVCFCWSLYKIIKDAWYSVLILILISILTYREEVIIVCLLRAVELQEAVRNE